MLCSRRACLRASAVPTAGDLDVQMLTATSNIVHGLRLCTCTRTLPAAGDLGLLTLTSNAAEQDEACDDIMSIGTLNGVFVPDRSVSFVETSYSDADASVLRTYRRLHACRRCHALGCRDHHHHAP